MKLGVFTCPPHVLAIGNRQLRAFIVVAHVRLKVLHAEFLVWDNPKWHVFRVLVFSNGPRQPAAHVLVVVEKAPHARLAPSASGEIGESVCVFPREVLVCAFIPTFLAREADNILAVKHLGLILREHANTALVGMAANGIVWHANGDPYHLLLFVATAAHHFHDPSLVGIADGKRLSLL